MTVGQTQIIFTSDSEVNQRGFVFSYVLKNNEVKTTTEEMTSTAASTTDTSTAVTVTEGKTNRIPEYNATCDYTVVERADHLILKSPGYPNGYPSDLKLG